MAASEPVSIAPFRISVSDEVLTDLADRLARTRFPDVEPVDDWSQGMPVSYARELAASWADRYDWRAREAKLNELDQFTTEIDGLEIHFVHARSDCSDATPLLISHGWPGSFAEFAGVIGPLNEAGFHVVIPSLPGFGFSGKPAETGWGVERIAASFVTLMARLGYDRYLAQGGDWGSSIGAAVAYQDPDHCAGVHMTLAMGASPVPNDDGTFDADAQAALDAISTYMSDGAGYSTQQATRPQTLGYGLADSPVGQMAWIVEKFFEWMECGGSPENVLTRDELLDGVMIYWVTNSAASSARLYWESFGPGKSTTGQVSVPSGFTVFPGELVPPVRRWCEAKSTSIVYWSAQPRGGHFAALELPEVYVEEVVAFYRAVSAR